MKFSVIRRLAPAMSKFPPCEVRTHLGPLTHDNLRSDSTTACNVHVRLAHQWVRRGLFSGMPFLLSQLYTVPTSQPTFAAISSARRFFFTYRRRRRLSVRT